MGDSERGEMQRTRASSSISHSIQYPPRPLRVMNPDLETESEDDLSRSDLLPEMTLDYTSQGSLPSSAPFTPPPHSPAQAPHDIAEHLKRQCIYINRSDDLNQLFNPLIQHPTTRSPYELSFHPPLRKDTKVDLRRAVPLRRRTAPSAVNSTRLMERLRSLSLSSGSESESAVAEDLDPQLHPPPLALDGSHSPDETHSPGTDSHENLSDDPFLTDLRRALFAGRTEADKILNDLTRPRAIQVMVWLQLELVRRYLFHNRNAS